MERNHDDHSSVEKLCIYTALLIIMILTIIMTALAGVSYKKVTALTGDSSATDPLTFVSKGIQLLGRLAGTGQAKQLDNATSPPIKPPEANASKTLFNTSTPQSPSARGT